MASVEAYKDDEAFARSLQALYDADAYEGDATEVEGGIMGRESDAEPEEFIPEGCRGKSCPNLRKKRLKKRRDLPSDRINVVLDYPRLSENQTWETTECDGGCRSTANSDANSITEGSRLTSKPRGTLYSEKEESLFLEGLNLFGRNWCKISSHVGTRDRASITSHAQKHFIQMWIRGDVLPEEVAKGGAGYSLSGKPLDPDSSSVRPYVRAYRNKVCRGEIEPAPHVEATLEKSKYWSNCPLIAPLEKNDDIQVSLEDQSITKKVKTREILSKSDTSPKLIFHPTNPPVVGADGKTEYSRNRPQRGAFKKHSRQYLEKGYELVKCLTFSSGQPFSLVVDRIAVAIIDFHSHLLDTEIVGVLAGAFDPDKKECIIQTAIPCDRKFIDTDTTISVEATEESLAEAVCSAHNLGMSIIGWYHSHPIFSTDPSYIDVNTQHEHQVAFHGYVYKYPRGTSQLSNNSPDELQSGCTGKPDSRPFIGAICGPYSMGLPTNKSELNWFVVANPARRQPYRLKAELTCGSIYMNNGIPKCEVEKMVNLAKLYKLDKYDSERHKFDRIWRSNVSYKSKLISSLKSWLRGDSNSGDEGNEIQSSTNNNTGSENACTINSTQLPHDETLSYDSEQPVQQNSDGLMDISDSKIDEEDNLPLITDSNFVSLNSLINQISTELDSFRSSAEYTSNA